jgi:hypothetical protein
VKLRSLATARKAVRSFGFGRTICEFLSQVHADYST